MVFYLQDALPGAGQQPEATIATVTVSHRRSLAGLARRRIRELRARAYSRGLILLYHRIATDPPDPFGLCVSPDHFAQHLDVVTQGFEVIPLASVAERLATRRLPRRWLALTFDDGYADNLHAALPLLDRHRLPATIFVTAGFVGSAEPLWSANLARLLLETRKLPPRLELEVAGRTHEFAVAPATAPVGSSADEPDWRVWHPTAPSSRHELLRSLHELLLPLPPAERASALERVRAWAGDASHRRKASWLSEDELRRLAGSGRLDIGAHSVSHSMLAAQPEAVQRDEIEHSRVRIEALIDQPVTTFAYPYGQRGSYSETTLRLTHDAGFAAACAGWPGAVTSATDPFELPRIGVEDVGGDVLARQLEHWWAAG